MACFRQQWIGSNWDLVNHQVPFACSQMGSLCAIIRLHFGFGSNRDLVNCQVPFAFHIIFIHKLFHLKISLVGNCVTSLPCWGRVVIGSNRVYQTRSAGSNPVTSTTVITFLTRPIGNGQRSWIRYAWEGLEKSWPSPILRLIGRLFHLQYFSEIIWKWNQWHATNWVELAN